MPISGYYYLHANGDLIYKPYHDDLVCDFRDSDFVRAFWPIDTGDRLGAWTLLCEALAAGASKQRVFELAGKWHCDNDDAEAFSDHAPFRLSIDGDQYCATRTDFTNLQEGHAGFGDTALEAVSDLLVQLGYKPSKMCGHNLESLLRT